MGNSVEIIGTVTKIQFNHEYKGKEYYMVTVEAERESGIKDYIPVLVAAKRIIENKVKIGNRVYVFGEYQSYNNRNNYKTKLMLYVNPGNITVVDSDYKDMNEIHIDGYVCKKPVKRETPLGRIITDIIIASNSGNKSYYIPVVAWERNAYIASDFCVGDNVILTGRIQSREYSKEGNVYTAYEVSAEKIRKENV